MKTDLRRLCLIGHLALFALLFSSCDMVSELPGDLFPADEQSALGDGWTESNAMGGVWKVSETEDCVQLDGTLQYDGETQRAISVHYLPHSGTMPVSYTVSFRIRAKSLDGSAVIRFPFTSMTNPPDQQEDSRRFEEDEYILDASTLGDGQWHDVLIRTNHYIEGTGSYYGTIEVDGNEVYRDFDGESFSLGYVLSMEPRKAWFLSAEKGSLDISVAGFLIEEFDNGAY